MARAGKFAHVLDVARVIELLQRERPDAVVVAYQDSDELVVTTWAGDPLKCVGLASMITVDLASDILLQAGLALNDPLHPMSPQGETDAGED